MKNCNFCGNKNIKSTQTEYTYKHNNAYLLVKEVPCLQCEYCGEQYFEAKVLQQIEKEFFSIQNGEKKTKQQIIMPTESFAEIALV